MARYDYDARPGNRRAAARTPRVTARYNLDYVEPVPEPRFPHNPNPFTDSRGPIVGPRAYAQPYQTIGGTRTGRGSDLPIGWERGRDGNREEQGHGSSRPRVGGYRAGYQGGSGGIEVDTTGPLRRGYDRDVAPRGYDREMMQRPRRRSRYDAEFDVRPEDFRPRFSPVGGMDAGMGGERLTRGEQRPLRESGPTSEWTRWF